MTRFIPTHAERLRGVGLNKCAAVLLPFVPPYPGLPWFDIIKLGPRLANGNVISKRSGIDPLVRAGLVAISEGEEKPNGQGRHWDRYYIVTSPVKLKTTGEVAALCGATPRDIRRWVARGDIPDGPRGQSGQGRGYELLWSPEAVEQALVRAKEHRGHDYNRPGMKRGPGRKLPSGIKLW